MPAATQPAWVTSSNLNDCYGQLTMWRVQRRRQRNVPCCSKYDTLRWISYCQLPYSGSFSALTLLVDLLQSSPKVIFCGFSPNWSRSGKESHLIDWLIELRFYVPPWLQGHRKYCETGAAEGVWCGYGVPTPGGAGTVPLPQNLDLLPKNGVACCGAF